MSAPPPYIHNHSPLALTGVYVVVMRERFSAENALPWVWTGNANTSSIYVYSEYDKQSEAANLAPLISVQRGPIAYRRVVVGDDDQYQPGLLRRGVNSLYQMAEVSLSIDCIGRTKGESATIADIVQSTIAATAKIVEQAFTLRRISEVLMHQTLPVVTDVEKYVTTLDFRANMETRWVTMPAASVLKKYAMSLALRTATDEYITTTFTGST